MPAIITETDVAHFLSTRANAIKLPEWASLSVTSPGYGGGVTYSVYGHAEGFAWVIGSGKSVAEALAQFTKQIPPTGAALAAKKREEAAKLLAEADTIDHGLADTAASAAKEAA